MDSDLEGGDGSAQHGRMHEEHGELDREWQARKQTFWNVRTKVHTCWCMPCAGSFHFTSLHCMCNISLGTAYPTRIIDRNKQVAFDNDVMLCTVWLP